jgi:CheY-like chemotaxis protein
MTKDKASDDEDFNHYTLSTTSSHLTILIVDDDKEIVDTASLYLTRKGNFTVQAFSDAVMAFEHFCLHALEYDMLLSDIRMPGMSGLQLARKVKQLNPNVKVILMTAFEVNESEFTKVIPSLKVDGFMRKPFQLKQLYELLHFHRQISFKKDIHLDSS